MSALGLQTPNLSVTENVDINAFNECFLSWTQVQRLISCYFPLCFQPTTGQDFESHRDPDTGPGCQKRAPRTVSWPAGQSSPDSEEGSVPSRPQQAAPECVGVAALGVGSSRTCRDSLLSLISGGGTARRRGWHGAAERLHAGPIRVLASTRMSFLMWDKLLSWP